MSSSGSGSMTPISGGVGIGSTRSRPLPYTLLSLPRYARVMGITPLHFFRANTPGLNPIIFPDLGCDSIWYKYEWQEADKVSHHQLAFEIHNAEKDIAEYMKVFPAPVWIEEEVHKYPRPVMREYYGSGRNNRGAMKSLDVKYGKFIAAGRRALTLVGTATTGSGSLVYTDEDSDGFYETATISLPVTTTDEREIKTYHVNTNGDPRWQIRDPRSVEISSGNVVMVFDSWLFIEPDLYEDYPTSDEIASIDVSTTSNFVASVDVYREYTDGTQASSTFYWEESCSLCGGSGCPSCDFETQNGCMHVRDDNLGVVVPVPASYDSDSGQWIMANWTTGYEPDRVRLWYRAGDTSEEYKQRRSTDPISHFWAQTIAWLASARLDRPVCGCSNLQERIDDLREDMIRNTRERTFFSREEVTNSAFGTRKGEVWAWRRVNKLMAGERKPAYAVI